MSENTKEIELAQDETVEQSAKEDTPPAPRPPSKHIPSHCIVCPFMNTIPFIPGSVNIYMCGHPKSMETTGGPYAVMPSEPPADGCPFVVYEEKYKDQPIKRAFWRWRLKRAKRMTN